MIPADSNVSSLVETCAEACEHVVGNETPAWSHKGAVGKLTARHLVPENYISETKDFVVKKIYRARILTDVEEKHHGALYAKICNDRGEWKSRERSAYPANIQPLQESFKSAEFDFA
jgi:hypothetical protein